MSNVGKELGFINANGNFQMREILRWLPMAAMAYSLLWANGEDKSFVREDIKSLELRDVMKSKTRNIRQFYNFKQEE